MKTGRPRILNNPVTANIIVEKKALDNLDHLKGRYSRGRYISIMLISDDMKTSKILDLKEDIYKLQQKIKELSIKNNENIEESFRKAIYSHFQTYAKDYIENKLSFQAKKMWCEKLNTKSTELSKYLW